MAYQSMGAASGPPAPREHGTVEVVDEGAGLIDELNGTRLNSSAASRRSRKGAALSLLVLAIGTVSALSAIGRRSTTSQAAGTATTKLAATVNIPEQSPEVSTQATPHLSELSDDEVTNLFVQFVNKFEKTYKSEEEAEMRREIFRRNLKRIDDLNAKSTGVRYEVSMWTDLTQEEYKSYQTNGKVSDQAKEFARARARDLMEAVESEDVSCQACTRFPELEQYKTGELPESFDWRDYGAVTKVKNQAYCGSCWSFSTTGCLEGAWFLSGHNLKQLSEQQLVTCDTEWNQGCNGGWPSLSMIYIDENGGIVPESIYPYRKVYMGDSPDPVCSDVVKDGNYAATLSLEVAVAEGSMTEEAMARWLILNGPLSVALDATGMDYYGAGIDMGEYCFPLDIDHAVLIVGYGVEDGTPYWIIKNSWAIMWGERGYYRLVRGENACGIADYVTAVIVGDTTTSRA